VAFVAEAVVAAVVQVAVAEAPRSITDHAGRFGAIVVAIQTCSHCRRRACQAGLAIHSA